MWCARDSDGNDGAGTYGGGMAARESRYERGRAQYTQSAHVRNSLRHTCIKHACAVLRFTITGRTRTRPGTRAHIYLRIHIRSQRRAIRARLTLHVQAHAFVLHAQTPTATSATPVQCAASPAAPAHLGHLHSHEGTRQLICVDGSASGARNRTRAQRSSPLQSVSVLTASARARSQTLPQS